MPRGLATAAAALPALAAAVLWTADAAAHEPGSGRGTGFVATVAAVRPNIVGVEARIVLGDQLHVSNLTRTPLEILDRRGDPFIRIRSGASRAWHDPRVVGRGDPPPPAPGAPEGAPRFVKNWTVPGRAAEREFTIEGFLGWVPPQESDSGSPSWLWFAGGALALTALSGAAAYLLGRGRA